MAKERATLSAGEWFMYPIDQGIPREVKIYTGDVLKRTLLRKISKMQALALSRWHGHDGLYHSYKDGNERYQDVHVVGDIDAWMGEDDEPDTDPGVPCPVCGATTWGGWCDDCVARENGTIED